VCVCVCVCVCVVILSFCLLSVVWFCIVKFSISGCKLSDLFFISNGT